MRSLRSSLERRLLMWVGNERLAFEVMNANVLIRFGERDLGKMYVMCNVLNCAEALNKTCHKGLK